MDTEHRAMWHDFRYDDVEYLGIGERAMHHAHRAERLLDASYFKQGTGYASTPINIVAAGVHAQLAAFWADMEER